MRRAASLALAVAALAAGCGSDDEKVATFGVEGAETSTEAATSTAPEKPADLKDTSQKPTIEKPTGSPPRKLETEDIVEGKGPAAKKGDDLTMQYVGVTFSTGEEFDASWDRGEPFTFPLGGGQVIKGWDQGIVGMKKGGRRKLTIPSDLAYGPQGSPPSIGPNEPLVFVVDVVGIK